ncbi:hypothetical protein V8G54_021783 [Vigna mungo]|uniref:HRDC domain-containing protein n=1 Tax=Vigna mungo TaxID=3915 RepID=A0AAQ3NGN8_VIGMU
MFDLCGVYEMKEARQASRVLKMERYSLQHLLQHFCGITANKEYQNADWRLRPLPDVMLRYGREDTHYLLYIYDLMRIKLFTLSKESEGCDNPLLEVYKRSYDICMQLYEKDLLTENSFLHLYGLRRAGFNAQQLAVVSVSFPLTLRGITDFIGDGFVHEICYKEVLMTATRWEGPHDYYKGLWEWRDGLARADDEGPGYVLPNKIILEIAKQMPVIISNLRRIVGRSKLPYVERSLDVIVNIVRHSMQNAAAFEEAALRLKEEHAASLSNVVPIKNGTEVPQTQNLKIGCAATESIGVENDTCIDISENFFSPDRDEECFQHEDKDEQGKVISNCLTLDFPSASLTISEKPQDAANVIALSTAKGNGEVLKLPTGTIDAPLLGYPMSEWKPRPNKKVKQEIKLEQIEPSDNLPSLFVLDNSEKLKLASKKSDPQNKPVSGSVSTSSPVGVVTVMSDSDSEDMQLKNSNNHPGKNSLVPRKRR